MNSSDDELEAKSDATIHFKIILHKEKQNVGKKPPHFKIQRFSALKGFQLRSGIDFKRFYQNPQTF